MTHYTDAHVHFWDTGLLDYPWLEAETDLPRHFTPTDLLANGAPNKAVFVEAGRIGSQALAEARWVTELAQHQPWIAGIVAHARVENVELKRELDELAALDLVVGVRRLLQDEPVDFLAQQELAAGLRTVGERGLVFDACVRHPQLRALVELCRAAPETTIVLDHLGKPPVTAGWDSDAARAWHRNLRLLAVLPGVRVKISGVAPEAGSGPLPKQARPFIYAVWDCFGPHRTLLGSDWPVSRRHDGPSYQKWVDFVLHECGLTPEERDAVAWKTAADVYGLAV